MATVLRVKRKNNDQPQNALILCKIPKLVEDGNNVACSDVISTVAKFAGTLKDPEENILKHLAKTLSKEELKTTFKKPPCINYLAQRRKQTKENSKANRYKVVNCHRSLDTSNIEEFEDKVMTFLDLEDSASLAVDQSLAATEEEEKNSNYVYDLYYAEDCDSIDKCISIHPYNEHEMVYETSTEDFQSEHDSEDSNAESYYQNSYPNTDYSDEDSINEDDMRVAIRDFENCNLSSEDDYEDYGDDGNEPYSLDMKDVEMHGYKYARYKQRMKSLFNEDIDVAADDQDVDNSSSDNNEETNPWNSNGSLVCTFNNSKNS